MIGIQRGISAAIRDQLGVVDGLWKNFKLIVAFASDPKTTAIPNHTSIHSPLSFI